MPFHVYMELARSKHICLACDALTDCVHDYRMQTVKDIPLARDTAIFSILVMVKFSKLRSFEVESVKSIEASFVVW